MPKTVNVGEAFSIRAAQSPSTLKEKRLFAKERTRSKLALVVVGSCLGTLLAAAIYGCTYEDFSHVYNVAQLTALPLGAVLFYYFSGDTR